MTITRFKTSPPPWQPPGFAVLIVVCALIAAVLIMWIGEPASALGTTSSSREAEQRVPSSRKSPFSGAPFRWSGMSREKSPSATSPRTDVAALTGQAIRQCPVLSLPGILGWRGAYALDP